MKKLLLLSALLIFYFGFAQTPITDANFAQAIETCLSTHPVTGMCSDSEYGAMPDWDVSQVTDMSEAFKDLDGFNADISNWDVSNVTTMEAMFQYTQSFNQPIENWNVSSVTSMKYMFGGTYNNFHSFNQPIGNWDVSSVNDMSYMFIFTTSFNQPIGNWDVSNVNTIAALFTDTPFNHPIGDWNVSNVTNMLYTFLRAYNFNQDLSNWDVSNVTQFTGTFYGAESFNQDISNWNTSNANIMGSMFYNATNFNQDLSSWDISNVGSIESNYQYFNRLFTGSNLSTENYDNILISWSQQSVSQNLEFEAEGIFYCNSETQRQSLIDNYGWIINDAGYNCGTASIDDSEITSFSIYPNPTKEYLNIDCSSLEGVFVYNILGKELIKESNNRINVSSLSNGVYFIKVSDGVNSSTKKFIKN